VIGQKQEGSTSMKPHLIRLSALSGVLLVALTLSACGGDDSSGASKKPFNATDVRFVQKMLPHHMQALRTSEVVIERGKDPQVKAIAKKINTAQKQEISEMQGYLKTFGAKASKPPVDQKMVWDNNLADEKAAPSPEQLDTIFLTNMVPHHAAAIPMSQMEIEMGKFSPTRKLAEQIKKTQRMEIMEMNQILRSKG